MIARKIRLTRKAVQCLWSMRRSGKRECLIFGQFQSGGVGDRGVLRPILIDRTRYKIIKRMVDVQFLTMDVEQISFFGSRSF
jgi:hypothetical protein